jgi:Flp pilus assembly protein TadG
VSSSASNKRRPLGRAGTSSVEFALVGGIVFLLFMGIADLSRYHLQRLAVRSAVADVARLALMDTSLTNCDPSILDRARLSGALDTAALTLCVARRVTGGISEVEVTANYTFRLITPALGTTPRLITEGLLLRM